MSGGQNLQTPGRGAERCPWCGRTIPPFLEHCCDPSRWGQLLCRLLDRSWQIPTQLWPSQTSQFRWAAQHPPVLPVDWDQYVPPQRTAPVSGWWKDGGSWGSWQPLQLAWTGPEDNLYPWPYSVSWRALWPLVIVSWNTGVCNFRCLQVMQGRWRETLLISSEPARFPFPYSFMYND